MKHDHSFDLNSYLLWEEDLMMSYSQLESYLEELHPVEAFQKERVSLFRIDS